MARTSRATPATVLLVENEALVRLELADWLWENGFVVLTANGADEAISLLDLHPEIGVMMTDIKMPGSMDGLRLAHHVRDRWPPVKILVTSGMLGTRLSDLPPGSLFLPKPLERARLRHALSSLLDGSCPRPVGPEAGIAA